MPIYEYRCADCHKPFELFVRAPSLADSAVCAHCHSTRVHRLISGFATVHGSSSGMTSAVAEAPGGGGCACGGGGCSCGGH